MLTGCSLYLDEDLLAQELRVVGVLLGQPLVVEGDELLEGADLLLQTSHTLAYFLLHRRQRQFVPGPHLHHLLLQLQDSVFLLRRAIQVFFLQLQVEVHLVLHLRGQLLHFYLQLLLLCLPTLRFGRCCLFSET